MEVDYDIYFKRAHEFYRNKQLDFAISECENALKLNNKDYNTHFLLGLCYKEKAEEGTVLKYTPWEKNKIIDYTDLKSKSEKVVIERARNKNENTVIFNDKFYDYQKKAIKEFEIAIKLCPKDVESHKHLVDLLIHNPRKDITINFLNQTMDKFPKEEIFQFYRAEIYMFIGLSGTNELNKKFLNLALRDLKKYLLNNPDDACAQVFLGHIYCNQNNLDEAITEFDKFLEFVPTDPYAYYLVGNAFFRSKLEDQAFRDQAEKYYKLSLTLDPSASNTRYRLAICYACSGKADESSQELEILLKNDPDNLSIHWLLGCELYDIFQDQDINQEYSKNEFKKCVDIKIDFPEPYYMLGEISYFEGNFEDTIKYFDLFEKYKKKLATLPDVEHMVNCFLKKGYSYKREMKPDNNFFVKSQEEFSKVVNFNSKLLSEEALLSARLLGLRNLLDLFKDERQYEKALIISQKILSIDQNYTCPKNIREFSDETKQANKDEYQYLYNEYQKEIKFFQEIKDFKNILDAFEQKFRIFIHEIIKNKDPKYWDTMKAENDNSKNLLKIENRINIYLENHPEQNKKMINPIDFFDWFDYLRIIQINWELFKPIFKDFNTFNTNYQYIIHLRNLFAHNYKLDKDKHKTIFLQGQGAFNWLNDRIENNK